VVTLRDFYKIVIGNDDWDRRLLNVYAQSFFNDNVINEEKYHLADASLPYMIPDEIQPKDGKKVDPMGAVPLFYENKIREFPGVERPEAFG
jgi:dynein heavy chain